MKVRASRNIHNTGKNFDEFKLTEFSKDLVNWIPDLSLSCNECEEKEDLGKKVDGQLSFVTKFKADKLNDPRKVKQEGISGIILTEDDDLKFVKEQGGDSYFHTVKYNHFNLILTEEKLLEIALKIYSEDVKKFTFNAIQIRDYILENYETEEWKNLFLATTKTNWKKYLNEILKSKFKSIFCELKASELKEANRLDPEGLKKELLILKNANALNEIDLKQIDSGLGPDYFN